MKPAQTRVSCLSKSGRFPTSTPLNKRSIERSRQIERQPVVNQSGVSWYNRRDQAADAAEEPITRALNERQLMTR